MKKIALLLSLFSIVWLSYGQEFPLNSADVSDTCDANFTIKGERQVRSETSREYSIVSSDITTDLPKKITYTLKEKDKKPETVTREKYTIYFDTPGDVTLTADIQYGNNCQVNITKNIQVLSYAIAYIGDQNLVKTPTGDIDTPNFIADSLEQRDVLFYELTPPPPQASISFQEFDDFMIKNIKTLEDSDVIIINSVNFLSLFDSLAKIATTSDIKSLPSKHIFVVSDTNESFLSKILGQSIGRLGITWVSLVQPSALSELLLQITPDNLSFGAMVSYSTETFSYSLSRFLDFLLYFGFWYSFLGLLLKVSIVVLVLNFLKQVIGVHIFSIYNPLFLALCFAIFGIWLTSIFLFLAFLATRIVNLISAHIPILYNTRRSLLITLYILLSLIFLWLDIIFHLKLVDYAIFSNIFTIFPFLFLIMVADKIFHEDINIWSKAGVISFIQFIIISLLTYGIFASTNLQEFLISYPDSLFAILIINFIIGRYTGLQVFEYIRFTPLLKKLQEEE